MAECIDRYTKRIIDCGQGRRPESLVTPSKVVGSSRERPDARHVRSALDRSARTGVNLGIEFRRDRRYGGRGI